MALNPAQKLGIEVHDKKKYENLTFKKISIVHLNFRRNRIYRPIISTVLSGKKKS
jgi:hypothetical protein